MVGRRHSRGTELGKEVFGVMMKNLGGFITEVEAESVQEAEGPGAHSWTSPVPLFARLQ